MTRHKHTHTGLVTPSPLDRWIDATLRLFAMLVLNVAANLRMIPRRGPVIGTQAMPMALPRETHDTLKEQTAVQQDSSPISAHAEQRSSAARPSKHTRGLTDMSHTSPSPLRLADYVSDPPPPASQVEARVRRGIASTAFGGGGGSPRSGLTEGVRHAHRSPNKNAPV